MFKRAFLGQVPLRGMGQASGPSSPGTAAAPAGTPVGNAIAAEALPSFSDQFFNQDYFNQGYGNYPVYPGYAPPSQPQQLACTPDVDPVTGEQIFNCVPSNPPAQTYPVYFANPYFF